jgi:dTDP-4-dehydrorhamnose 3,5-epimerase
MPFIFEKLSIQGLYLIKQHVFGDERGFFMETFKKSEFSQNGVNDEFVQDNHSSSASGVLRGLHYQLPPYAQGKMVRCLKGSIFDVAVDIRRESKTFMQWYGSELSFENKHMLYIPPGFAHAFYTISDTAEIHYKASAEYAPEYDRGIIWNDSQLAIKWPSENVILSQKDANLPSLSNAELF